MQKKQSKAILVLGTIVGAGIVGLLFLTWSVHIKESHCGTRSRTNLKQLMFAMNSYYEKHRHYPPAVVYDQLGRPLYSWRVLLLRHLNEDDLYRQFCLDEPWDSLSNKPLLSKMPAVLRMGWRREREGLTHYQVIVGPGSAFETNRLTVDDFPDGIENTVFVVEAEEPVPWTKPADVVFDGRKLPQLLGQQCELSWFELPFRTPSTSFATGNGAIGPTHYPVEQDMLRAVISRNGDEAIDWFLGKATKKERNPKKKKGRGEKRGSRQANLGKGEESPEGARKPSIETLQEASLSGRA